MIASRHRFPAFKREIRAFFSGYQQLVRRIREVVRTALPAEATIIVVSKGDNELLELDGKRVWHFPQNEEGVYAGYHPSDSAEAIAHLEELRAKGGDSCSSPVRRSGGWRSTRFGQHLEDHYRRVRNEEICIIFELSEL